MEDLRAKDPASSAIIVIATRNAGKVREIEGILGSWPLTFLSLREFPELPPVIEDGATFAANAAKKAAATARLTGHPAIADDSGIAVDALQGRPGVFSARYAGEAAQDRENWQKLLAEMAGIPEGRRQGAFVCAIAVASPGGRVEIAEADWRGTIAFAPRGANGFGYDPIFFIPEFGKTVAELDPELKNRISHRGKALAKMKEILPDFLQ